MNNKIEKKHIGVFGATSLVGSCLLPQLVKLGYQVNAFSRRENKQLSNDVIWQKLSLFSVKDMKNNRGIPYWICVAPIWTLPDYFELLENFGVRRLVVLSSTSRFTKDGSPDAEEQLISNRLADAENVLQKWASRKGIDWVILRPTLIYGHGRDKNIVEITRFINRFGFFPLFGKAMGLRQPIHAEDVATACVSAVDNSSVANQNYNITGGETLTYREMVSRVFQALGKNPRFVSVPLWVFKLTLVFSRLLPRYRHWSAAMAERMNRDLVFDSDEASNAFGYRPRVFSLSKKDVEGTRH